MRVKPVVIRHILCEQTREMLLAQHNDMIKEISADAANEPFDLWVLLWTPGGDQHLGDSHVAHALPKVCPVNAVSIAQEIAWCSIPRKRFDHLLSRPPCGGMLRHGAVHDPSPFVGEDHQY